MTLKDYDLSEKLLNRLTDSKLPKVWIVAGSPGSGKSTFASALAMIFICRKKNASSRFWNS